jgi:hypothetical protein
LKKKKANCHPGFNIAFDNIDMEIKTKNTTMVNRAFFKNSSVGGIYKKDHTILTVERYQIVVGNKKFGVVSQGDLGFSHPENICIFLPLELQFLNFLK